MMNNKTTVQNLRTVLSLFFRGQKAAACAALLISAGSLNTFASNDLGRGTIYFTDSQATVLKTDASATGPQIVATSQALVQPLGICVAANGELLVTDTGCFGVLGIDPASGNQRLVASGDILGIPFGIATEPSGTVLVANAQYLVRVNPTTGAKSIASTGQFFRAPLAVAVSGNGTIYVADGLGCVLRVDPATGTQTVVAAGGYLHRPQGIAVRANDIYVTDVATPDGNFGIGTVIHVDARTGQQAVVSEGGYLVGPVGITVTDNGQLIVGDPYTINEQSADLFDGGIIQIDPHTHDQTLIARGQGNLVNPRGVAFVKAAQ